MNLETLEGKGLFKQKIRRTTDKAFSITGYVEYMACNDKTCTPPIDKDFVVKINPVSGKAETATQKEEIPVTIANKAESDSMNNDTMSMTQGPENPESVIAESYSTNEKKSLWGIILLSILGGLGALITPCVYPMIPLTVSFFLRGTKSRSRAVAEALVFGFSIMAIYTLLGVLVAIFKNPNAVNTVSTHWLLNSIFFVVFIILALSFFGLFEIVLPASLSNTVDRKADKGGFIGAFFVALGMTILSFSCTGPIVASLLIKASQGEVLEPVAGMFSFGLIFAIPFTFFAIFPSWLKSLPKSGGWLALLLLCLLFHFIFSIKLTRHTISISLPVKFTLVSGLWYLACWDFIFWVKFDLHMTLNQNPREFWD